MKNIKKAFFAFTAAVVISNSAIISMAAESPEVIVFDKKYAWTDSTVIDLFERNELGNQLVFPGVTGQYSFTVRNKSAISKECEVIIEDENNFAVPLDVRIKKDGEYIIGSENEWAVSAAFDSDIYMIEPESDNVYELEWKWDFYNNDDDDIRDTILGVNAHYENEPYNVNIKVLAETEPESSVPETSDNSKPDPPENSVPEPSVPQDDKYVPPITGDNGNTEIIVTLSFIASSLFIMVISSITSFRERNKVKK